VPSVSTALQFPRRLERVFYGSPIARCQVGNDHHVLHESARKAEGLRRLEQYNAPVVEIGPDHEVGVVDLTGDQPAVVPPLRSALDDGRADVLKIRDQNGDVF
jgi:hypothetical protein